MKHRGQKDLGVSENAASRGGGEAGGGGVKCKEKNEMQEAVRGQSQRTLCVT